HHRAGARPRQSAKSSVFPSSRAPAFPTPAPPRHGCPLAGHRRSISSLSTARRRDEQPRAACNVAVANIRLAACSHPHEGFSPGRLGNVSRGATVPGPSQNFVGSALEQTMTSVLRDSRRHGTIARLAGAALILVAAAGIASAQSVVFQGQTFVNKGLVGVARVPSNARDQFGDTLGGFGSGMAMDLRSWHKNRDGSYSGILHMLPDRGW